MVLVEHYQYKLTIFCTLFVIYKLFVALTGELPPPPTEAELEKMGCDDTGGYLEPKALDKTSSA